MKFTTTLVLGAAMVTSAWVSAPPQISTEQQIAFINGDRILEGSNIGRQARERLEMEAGNWQNQMNTVQSELEALSRNRTEQAMTLNETAMARLNQDIEEKQVQLDRMNDDARRELTRLEQQITLDVNSQLGPLVERFAVDNGIEVIFDGARLQGVLYVDQAVDVTDDFLAIVNATADFDPQR